MKIFVIVLVTLAGVLGVVAAFTFELDDWLTVVCAIPAGIGGALLGDRGMAWLIEHGWIPGR